MKLVFIGVTPSEDLRAVLLANHFEVESHSRFNKELQADILMHAPTNVTQLKTYDQIRASTPGTWITVLLPRKMLSETKWKEALLTNKAKNDVGILEDWEDLFWFSLERILQHKSLEKSSGELQSHYDELSKTSTQLVSELEKNVGLATNIQRTLLPKHAPDIPGVSLTVKYVPASGGGGDYYDIIELGDRKRFGILLADSKSHGMAATLLSVLLKVRLEEMKDRFPDTPSFLSFLNQEVRALEKEGAAHLSLLYGVLDRSTLSFEYTVAGELSPFLWRNGSRVNLNSHRAPPLGAMDHFSFQATHLTLQPSDLLLLHTDGLSHPLSQKYAEFKSTSDQLEAVFKLHAKNPDPLEVQNDILGVIGGYRRNKPLPDDITLIQLTVNARVLYMALHSK